jgi:hypothetical protein
MSIKLAARANGKVLVYRCDTMDYELAIETVRDALKSQGINNPVILALVKPSIIVELEAA